jgi:hypothetical protein
MTNKYVPAHPVLLRELRRKERTKKAKRQTARKAQSKK